MASRHNWKRPPHYRGRQRMSTWKCSQEIQYPASGAAVHGAKPTADACRFRRPAQTRWTVIWALCAVCTRSHPHSRAGHRTSRRTSVTVVLWHVQNDIRPPNAPVAPTDCLPKWCTAGIGRLHSKFCSRAAARCSAETKPLLSAITVSDLLRHISLDFAVLIPTISRFFVCQ